MLKRLLHSHCTGLLVLVIAMSASSAIGQTKSSKSFPIADTISIQQAIYNDLMARKVNHGYFKASVIFIAAGPDEHDPIPTVLASYQGHNPPVFAKSDAKVNTGGAYHRKDGRRGVVLNVWSIKRKSTGACEAVADVFYAGKAGGSFQYTLDRSNGKWTVIKGIQTQVY